MICFFMICLFWGEVSPISLEQMTFPGTAYDVSVPKLDDVVGFAFGEDMTMHYEAMAYARALDRASPLVKLASYGASWEGRELALLIVTAKKNLDQLEKIKSGYRALANPLRSEIEAVRTLIQNLPACVWFSESVHGNETSGTDSGLFLAYHLAAGYGNQEIKSLLDNVVVVIDLMQNPDGRDRFITYSRQTRSPGGDSDSHAAEHHEVWPGSRSNHYLFDLNRDWFATTQKETRAKMAQYLSWFPQVVVDVHELGRNSSFFAATPAEPANPLLPDAMIEQYQAFGRAIGKVFDARRIDYFHNEIFDSFFPGYGESWPSLHGSIGLLFEQARVAGLRVQRYDGTVICYRDAVRNQTLASFLVAGYAADHRQELLDFFYTYRREATKQGREAAQRQVILLPGTDPGRSYSLARQLERQGIEVERLEEPIRSLAGTDVFEGEERKFEVPSGSYLVRFGQPAGRLAQTLLLPHIPLHGDFVSEQERRYEKRMQNQIFDITGWSLPLMHGAPAIVTSGSGFKGIASLDLTLKIHLPDQEPHLGYLLPYGIQALRSLSVLVNQGVRMSFTTAPIVLEGREFPRGTVLIRRKDNPPDLHNNLLALARSNSFDVFGVDQSWFDQGPAFGSNLVYSILPSRIALLWGEGVSSQSAGWNRYILEQDLGVSVTLVHASQLKQVNLADFDILFMPDGRAERWVNLLNKAVTEKIRNWVSEGGVLVATGGAGEWLTQSGVDLLSSALETRGGLVDPNDAESKREHPVRTSPDAEKMVTPIAERPRKIRGALVRVDFDLEHWLAFGLDSAQCVMADSDRVFRPVRLDKGVNVGRFAAEEDLVVSGYVPKEVKTQLALKAFSMVEKRGQGMVIAFTQDPHFRGFLPGLLPLTGNILYFSRAIGYKRAY